MNKAILLFSLVAISICSRSIANEESKSESSALYCSRDIKLCPGDKFVVRDIDNNCEFFPCPDVYVFEDEVELLNRARKRARTLHMCTREGKPCPDGSTVFRNEANDCEFDECPVQQRDISRSRSFHACTREGITCPDGSLVFRNAEKNCDFDKCPVVTRGVLRGSPACPRDIRFCDDGSMIVRMPELGCEFEKCPETANSKRVGKELQSCPRDIKVCDDDSVVFRDGYNNCEFPECPP